MKFKKILSSVVAAAMAVTTFSAFSTTATAEDVSTTNYITINGASSEWQVNFTTSVIQQTIEEGTHTYEFSFDVGNWGEATLNYSGGNAVQFLLVDTSGAQCYSDIELDIYVDDELKIDGAVPTYNPYAWDSKSSASVPAYSYALTQADSETIGDVVNKTVKFSVTVTYEPVTTDIWVDNGDGSYSLTRGTAASPAKFTISLDDGENHIATAVAITVEGGDGYTNGCFGSMVYDGNPGGTWENVTWDEESAVAIYNPSSSLETYPEFQVCYAAVGTKITISLVQSVYAYTKYEQQTNDGSACRGVMYIHESEVENIESVDFYFSNDGGVTTKKVSSTKYYESVSVGGSNMTAPDGYVIVAYAIKDIPVGASVTCEDIKLNWI